MARSIKELPPRVAIIVNEVCAASGLVSPEDVLGTSCFKHIIEVRHEIWWRVRRLETKGNAKGGHHPSFPQIGRWFNRNHSTIYNGIARHEQRLQELPLLALMEAA